MAIRREEDMFTPFQKYPSTTTTTTGTGITKPTTSTNSNPVTNNPSVVDELVNSISGYTPVTPNINTLGQQYGLATSMNDPAALQQLALLNSLSQQQRNTALESSKTLEQDMYRAIGLQQQQLEGDIRKRRQQALKGGATSAQLAAQELQTLLAAQQGAQMYADQYARQRMDLNNQYAGYEQQNLLSMLGLVRDNNMNLANIGTQQYVGELSYRAQALAPIEQAFALMQESPGLTLDKALETVLEGKTDNLKQQSSEFKPNIVNPNTYNAVKSGASSYLGNLTGNIMQLIK